MTSRIGVNTEAELGQSGEPHRGLELPAGGSVAEGNDVDAPIEEIRKRYGSNLCLVFPRLEDRIRRRVGLAPLSAAALVLAGFVGIGIRLTVALLATALAGEWTAIPWARWAPILLFVGFFEATQPLRTPPLDTPSGPRVSRVMEDWTSLLTTVAMKADLEELAGFTRRWYRLPMSIAAAAAIAAIMLVGAWASTPAGMGELPIGTLVLLTFLLYQFGESIYMSNLFVPALVAREARYDHDLFWPSPVDSPEVQRTLRSNTLLSFGVGIWITLYLVLTVYLVSWDSPVVVPLAIGFLVIGYLSTIGSALSIRGSVRRIVERVRRRRLEGLQRRIDAFGPRYTELSPQESQQLRDLLDLHTTIRDAPGAPSTTHTVAHSAVGLIIPTVIFILTVFGEVYAERTFDALLP